MLVQITAPHFCAGLVVERDKVVEAAPILGWTMGQPYSYIKRICVRRGWRVHEH